MIVLVLAGRSWDGVVVPCDFAVTVDGTDLEVSTLLVDAVEVPETASSIRILATPTSGTFWEDEFDLVLIADEIAATVAHQAKVAVTAETVAGLTIVRADLTVSRVRDASAKAREQLTRNPAKRLGKPDSLGEIASRGDFPPDYWALPDRPGTRFIDAARPLAGNLVNTTVADAIGTDVECLVFEVAGVKVPRLIAVSWPASLLREDKSNPTPFLVYYHPGTGQNVGAGFYVGGGLDPYPWNFDFCYFVMFAYQWYALDPLTESPYSKGIPFQIAAGGKNVVSVIPCNAPVGNEFGSFGDAASIEAVLLEIQAAMFRRAGVATPPSTLGRTAASAFSSGNNFLAAMLSAPKNRAHHFITDVLQEVYFFDPPGNLVDDVTAAALGWSGAPDTGRRVALYANAVHNAHAKLLGRAAPAAPFIESPSSARTAAVTSIDTWRATVDSVTGTKHPSWGFDETHQVISAMMLTHAIATSGF